MCADLYQAFDLSSVLESLLLLQPFKPAQQQTDVFRQLFSHDVAGRLTQRLTNFVEEDHVGQLRIFWPKANADETARIEPLRLGGSQVAEL
jgi:hypothetical protein